ncbi:MAG: hypothetical protein RL541_333, partial [Pseudomonadota bacterium]
RMTLRVIFFCLHVIELTFFLLIPFILFCNDACIQEEIYASHSHWFRLCGVGHRRVFV